ncbi:MAG: helicase C-terminal domain-containing protein, partial [Firmicutes bacterium]|nr:helicase C-terminal domain-containing protein [Bacillota bacterium]
EGVDLTGEKLIGAAVVGVGLPQVGQEPNTLRAYYDRVNGAGFEFAYQYPGMNKVLQAAGRVIRTEQDAGAVLLIDDRFLSSRYRNLLPPHWNGLQRSSAELLPGQLQEFWSKFENEG